MSRENLELVRTAVGALGRGDVEAYVARCTEDVELTTAGVDGPHQGEIRELRAAPDGRVVIVSHIRWASGRTGIELERDIGSVVTVRDGRIVRTEFFATPGDALEAAGLGR